MQKLIISSQYLARRNIRTAVDNPRNDSGSDGFRVLKLKKETKFVRPIRKTREYPPPRYRQMSLEQDWTQAWPTQHTFNQSSVPLPLRQGLITTHLENDGIVPSKYGNAELMKIPNFLHLTPAHIKLHCDAIKGLCTKFPEQLKDDAVCRKAFPVQITTSDYVQSSADIRDERSRVVRLSINVKSLNMSERSNDKIRRLAGPDYFCAQTDSLELVASPCPHRRQNTDYSYYLLASLYLESVKHDEWEDEKTIDDWEKYYWERSPAKSNIDCLLSGYVENSESRETLQQLKESYKQAIISMYDNGETSANISRYTEAVEKLNAFIAQSRKKASM